LQAVLETVVAVWWRFRCYCGAVVVRWLFWWIERVSVRGGERPAGANGCGRRQGSRERSERRSETVGKRAGCRRAGASGV